MATILKGRRKGSTVTLHQWCNDWFHVHSMQESYIILAPTNIQLNPEEIERVKASNNNGFLFMWYELSPNGTFKKRKS